MLNRLITTLFIIVILGILFFSIFSKFGEKAKVNDQPINYFPEKPIFLIGINNLTKTLDHFTTTNMIWSSMEDDTLNLSLNKLKKQINMGLLSDSTFNDVFSNGKTYFAFYSVNDTNEWIIAKNIFTEANDINIDSLLELRTGETFYASYISPFITISSSKDLLSQLESNINSGEKSHNSLKSKMSFSSEMTKVSCLLDIKQFNNIDEFSSVFNFIPGSSFLFENEDWIQFDIDYSPNDIKIIGISNEIKSIKISPPNYFSFTEIIPDQVESLYKRTLEINLDSNENNTLELQTIRLKFFDEIQNQDHEVLIIENPLDSGIYSKFLAKILIDSIIVKSNSENLRMINSSFVNQYFDDFNFKNKFCFLGDYYMILSSEDSKKELDYKLAHKSKKSLDKAILEVNNNNEYDQAQSLYCYQSKNEITQKFKSAKYGTLSISSSFIKSIEGISWTINNFSKRIHHGLVIKKLEKKKTEKNILWRLVLPPLSWGPYTLKNHRTGTKDIAVLDTSNVFYLIGANGKVKWSKALSQPILGGISQIDGFDNNKYQMVFNTENELHILDILGNEIDYFPIKFSFKASNEVAVFDYDHNNDYRLIVGGDNGKIYNYNLNGNKVKGWQMPKLSSHVGYPISHFAINGKDYILSIQKDGKVNLFNRKGEKRFKVKTRIPIASKGSFNVKKSYVIDSSLLIFEDTLGSLSEFRFSGLGNKFSNEINSGDSAFLFSTKQRNEIRYYLKNNKELKIIDGVGQTYSYSLPYSFNLIKSNSLKSHTGIINQSIGELQLIDNKYRLNPTLFRGSEMMTVDDVNNDNSVELLTIINKTILVCYQIPALK